jgi:hypothetical protein
MAASFPNAKKTFTQVVNGVTKLVAALFNSPYDEVEAIETFIGPTGGGAQAYSESVTNLAYNYRKGASVDYKGTADLYVRAGEIMITDASGNKRLRRNAADTTVDWGDIDTGSEANSTTYYVYATADASGTGFGVTISAHATTPTGFTFYRLIGTFFNNSSGNILEVANLNRDLSFGNIVVKANNTVYLAATDGFVRFDKTSGDPSILYSDTSNPPTTVWASFYTDGSNQYMYWVPIKKGYYWKTLSAANVYWMPLS